MTRALATDRVVALVGLGGVGKSRLALRVAHDSAKGGRPALVVDLHGEAAESSADRVTAALASTTDRPAALVVLDGVDPSVARTLVAAATASSNLSVLLTGRGPLDVEGVVVAVPPLDDGDAATVLRERAAALGVRVDPRSEGRIVAAAGGLPLALEMAAARLRTVSAADLADLLEGRASDDALDPALASLVDDAWHRADELERSVVLVVSSASAGLDGRGVADVLDRPAFPVLDALQGALDLGLVHMRRRRDGTPLFRVPEPVRRRLDRLVEDGTLRTVAATYGRWCLDALGRDDATVPTDDGRAALAAATADLDDSRRVTLGRVAAHRGWWAEAVAVLEPVSQRAEAQSPLGLALLRPGPRQDVARARGLLEAAARRGDADAAAVLGGSWREDDPAASLGWYRRALELDPDDGYSLGNVVEREAGDDGVAAVVARRRHQIEAARDRRWREAAAGVQSPWCWYDLAKLDLLLGEVDHGLHAVLEAGARTTTSDHATSSRRSLELLAAADQQPVWQEAVALLDLVVRGRRRAAARAGGTGAVVVLCGASSTEQHREVMAWLEPLAAALPEGGGTLVSGGTGQGVSALAAALAARGQGWRSHGYLPEVLPDGVAAEPAYDVITRTPATAFGVAEPLAYWTDLLDSGVDPTTVRVLGIRGGALTALELHLALVLGARVAAWPDPDDDARIEQAWRARLEPVRRDPSGLASFLS